METASTSSSVAPPVVAPTDLLAPTEALRAVRQLCVDAVDKMRFESIVRRYFLMLRCASGFDTIGGDTSSSGDELMLDEQVLADQVFLLRCYGIAVPTTRDVRQAMARWRGETGLAPPGHMRLVSGRPPDRELLHDPPEGRVGQDRSTAGPHD